MAPVIEPLGHHELLLVVVQLLALLTVARVLGEAFSRVGQPAVVGELLAGVLLGPSVFGVIVPSFYEALFVVSESQFHLLEIVSWIGLLMLLIVTGLETDIDLILSKGRTAVLLSLGGILVPFASGFALGWFLPLEFIAAPDQRLVFSLFIATAMSISAIPVIAKVLIELDVIRRDIGQLILAAGMVDDTIGWVLLATVAGLAQSGVVDVNTAVVTIISVVIFLALAFTVGRRLVADIVRWVDTSVGGETAMITTLMVLALAAAAITQYLGLEAILGAFVVGILVGQLKRFDHRLRHTFEVMTLGVFAPVFFAIAGLRMNVVALLDPAVVLVAGVVLTVACFGKFAGILSVSGLAGLSRWEGITIGGGMNARGAMEIIVATIGLGLGILTNEMYSIIVLVAIVTSLLAPTVMRWSIPKIEMSPDERARLEREKRRRGSFLAGIGTILLPTRCSPSSQLAAQLVGSIASEEEIEVTSMFVQPHTGGPSGGRFVRTARRLGLLASSGSQQSQSQSNRGSETTPFTGAETRSVTAESVSDPERCLSLMRSQLDLPRTQLRTIVRSAYPNATEAVLTESPKYDLLVLGATAHGTNPGASPFGAVIDEVVRDTSCPTMIVRSATEENRTVSSSIERILLPTTGTQYSRHAAEIAFTIARHFNAIVEVVTVVTPPPISDRFVDRPDMTTARDLSAEIVDVEADLGQAIGAPVTTNVIETEREPHEELVHLTAEGKYDLVVLGSSIRPTTQRAFFGHRVEHILQNAACSVTVVSSR